MNKAVLSLFITIFLFNKPGIANDTIDINLKKYSILSASAIITSFGLDKNINKDIINLNSRYPKLKKNIELSSILSDNITTYGVVSLMYVYGIANKNTKLCKASITLFKGLTISNGIALASKTISGRYRPNPNEDKWIGPPLNFQEFKYRFQNDIDSYFSGHAVRIWTMASITEELTDNKAIINSIYGLAILSSSARIIEGEHWLSDVVTGIIVGYGVGKLTILLEKNRKNKKNILQKTQ